LFLPCEQIIDDDDDDDFLISTSAVLNFITSLVFFKFKMIHYVVKFKIRHFRRKRAATLCKIKCTVQ